ncbi:MAG: type 4a pilus biogenesis protein PilO [Patescibacteria group bacterium]
MTESLLTIHRYHRYYKNITPLFKNRSVQAYTMVILSLFTISFFGVFAIRPTLKTIATLQRQIIDKSFVDEKLEQKINMLIEAQEQYQRIEKELPVIYSLLPEKAEFPALLRQLEIVVIQNEATISGISFDSVILYGDTANKQVALVAVDENTNESAPVQDNTISTPLFFNLIINGSYDRLVNLLEQLTRLDRLITIHSVELTSSGKEAQSTLNLGVKSSSYYYPNAL